jgi:class 3 adenylate cyclase
MAAKNGDVASFCPACGTPAHAAGGVRKGLRRTVTVLFADIVGFTSLIDDMDCEDVRALQRDYFATVSAVVRAVGGVVEKYVGDAVMAIFDTPQVPEHAAARAVRAGLAVQRVLRGHPLAGRFTVATRVGIATGEAIVECAAIRDGGQAMLSGKVVSTAARLQAYAPHDTVVVCAATRRATDGSVAYQDLPAAAVPGRRQPLELWRVLDYAGGDVPARRVLLAGR